MLRRLLRGGCQNSIPLVVEVGDLDCPYMVLIRHDLLVMKIETTRL